MPNLLNQKTNQEVYDIYKALSSNNFAQLQGPENQTGGAALIPESLENTLKVLTFNETHLKLWKDIPKVKAFSTVEEFNVVDSYGEEVSAFQREGIAGQDTTANYMREFAKIKCLNTTRSVTHLMTLLRTTQDPESLETQAGMKYLLGQAERSLFYGDSKLAPNGQEGLEWDGLMKTAENTIDLKGQGLDDKSLNSATEVILNNYGMPNTVYMPTQAAALFSEQYYPDQRAIMNVQAGTVVAGTTISQFNTIGGTIDIKPDVFMRRGIEELDVNAPAYGDQAPTAPTFAVALGAEDGVANFEEGTYKYAVVAYSSGGKSAVVEQTIAVDGASKTKAVELTITNNPNQIFPADYFVIYRSEPNGTALYEIGRIGVASTDKSAETKFVDKNETIAGTATAIVGDFNPDTVVFKQLAPMFKLPYAITGPMKRFGIFLYGAPVMYAPKKFVVLKNIKVKRG